jgi:hypothetical protein
MNDCDDCTTSAQRMWHGFNASCRTCQARAIARGPDFHRSMQECMQTKRYRHLLTMADKTHAAVLAAARADFMLRHKVG